MTNSNVTLRRPVPDPAVVRLQHLLLAQGYFRDSTPFDGLFDDVTDAEVRVFQSQHIGENGAFLSVDGVVGNSTWWALENASGAPQRSGIQGLMPGGLTETRQRLLQILFEEHRKDVREIPNGSNASPDIDQYWGNTGLRALPWCCAFVSWSLQECLGRLPIGNQHHVGVMKMWRAARRLGMGTTNPKPGDILIQDLGGGKGHTGFVISCSTDGKQVYTCEGNSGNRLKLGKRSLSQIDHFVDALQDGQDLGFERVDFSAADLQGDTTR